MHHNILTKVSCLTDNSLYIDTFANMSMYIVLNTNFKISKSAESSILSITRFIGIDINLIIVNF